MVEVLPLYDTIYQFIVINSMLSVVALYIFIRLFFERYLLKKRLDKKKELLFPQYRLLVISLLFLSIAHVFRIATNFVFYGFFELISLATFLIVLKRTWQELKYKK